MTTDLSERYADRFCTALRLAVAEGATTIEVARSRATLLTARRALREGLSVREAEQIRSDVFREEAARQGREPMSGNVVPGMYGAEPGRHEDVLQVPRGRALDGDDPRRGGKR